MQLKDIPKNIGSASLYSLTKIDGINAIFNCQWQSVTKNLWDWSICFVRKSRLHWLLVEFLRNIWILISVFLLVRNLDGSCKYIPTYWITCIIVVLHTGLNFFLKHSWNYQMFITLYIDLGHKLVRKYRNFSIKMVSVRKDF